MSTDTSMVKAAKADARGGAVTSKWKALADAYSSSGDVTNAEAMRKAHQAKESKNAEK